MQYCDKLQMNLQGSNWDFVMENSSGGQGSPMLIPCERIEGRDCISRESEGKNKRS